MPHVLNWFKNFELNKKNINYLLLLFIAAAAFIRIAALFSLRETIYWDFLLYDERIFHQWAKTIAEKTFISKSGFEFAPLFPYIMGIVYKLFGVDIFYVRLMNIIFGTLSCYIIYLIGKESAGIKVGLLSCFFAVVYEPFIFYSVVPLKGALSVLLFALIVYFFLLSLNKQRALAMVFCGFFLGLMINVRPQVLILVPLLPGLILFEAALKRYPLKKVPILVCIYLGGIILAVSPFVAANYKMTGKVFLTTTQSGFNLYRAYHQHLPYPVNFAITSPAKQEIQFQIEAIKRTGETLSKAEASDFWKKQTIQIIRTQPSLFFNHLYSKTASFFQQYQLTDMYHIGFMAEFMKILKFPFLTFSILMPLGLTGLVFTVARTRFGYVLMSFFLIYGSTMIIFFVRTRYRLPLMAILIPMSAAGLLMVCSAIKNRQYRQIGICFLCICMFTGIQFLPVMGKNDITAYYNGHALALSSQGKKEAALTWWHRSLDAEGVYSDFAKLSLAGSYLSRKEFGKSKKYLELISDDSYAAAQKYFLLGENYLYSGKLFHQAAAAYERSFSYNAGQIKPLKRLVHIYKIIDPSKVGMARRRLAYVRSFYVKNKEDR